MPVSRNAERFRLDAEWTKAWRKRGLRSSAFERPHVRTRPGQGLELNVVTKGVDQAHETRSDVRPARPIAKEYISGVMPLPAMYEFLRANLDYVGAYNAARQMLADERSIETRTEH